eukprot:scaffold4518_cov410-Prasinococcus_capsulatus_cf.AAC.8
MREKEEREAEMLRAQQAQCRASAEAEAAHVQRVRVGIHACIPHCPPPDSTRWFLGTRFGANRTPQT